MKTMTTKLTGRTLTSADFGMPSCASFSGRGLSFAGAGFDATRAFGSAVVAAAPAGNGNDFGAWDARRVERPMSASVAISSVLLGGYGEATGAGAGSKKHLVSLQHQSEQQEIAVLAITKRAFRGPQPWIDRT